MWVNHHLLMHAAKHPDGRLLWANNFLLFSMSLIPFATAFLGQHYTEALPGGGLWSGDDSRRSGIHATAFGDWAPSGSRSGDSCLGAPGQELVVSIALCAFGAAGLLFRLVVDRIFVLIPTIYFMPESLSDVDPNAAHRH
jgi:hypothetical protein